jgi:electron transport complex protein RnfC
VHGLTRHLRGLLVALATLALSAGVVVAARPASVDAPPAAAADGLSTATQASGKSVPVRAEAPAAPAVDEDEDVDQAAPEVDEVAEAAPAAAGERPQNHGWFVSQAAKGVTPAGADNHGQVVSTVARSDAGKPAAATAAREHGAAASAAGKANKPAKTPKGGNH